MFIYAKIIICAIAISFATFAGYYVEHLRFLEYKTEVESQAKIQEEHNKAVVIEQQAITNKVSTDYETKLANIKSYYGGLHNSSSSNLPSPGTTASQSNEAPSYSVLAEECAMTTQQVLSLQQWINEQVGIK